MSTETNNPQNKNRVDQEFEDKTRAVIKWLNDNMHPHAKVIITPTSAELVEGRLSTGEVLDYVHD